MNHYLELVQEFHESFEHPVEESIVEDNFELRKLRLSLIFEEMVELAHAMGCTDHLESLCGNHTQGKHGWLFNGQVSPTENQYYNKRESLDALCDIQYVLSGAVLCLGYKNVFDQAFGDVHTSNMSKMCEDMGQVKDTIEYHRNKGEKQLMSPVEKNGRFIVVREDGKIMKNKYYNPVDLTKFV